MALWSNRVAPARYRSRLLHHRCRTKRVRLSIRAWTATALFVATTIAPSFIVGVSPAQAAVSTTAVSGVWVEPASGYGFLDAAVSSARSSIDLSMYELSDPAIERDLVARAKAGVDVRVVLNSAYDGTSENSAAASVLRAGSVHVVVGTLEPDLPRQVSGHRRRARLRRHRQLRCFGLFVDSRLLGRS